MASRDQSKREAKEWRAFELLVAAIEKRMALKGAIIRSPDRVTDLDTGNLREVDATIRFQAGSVDILITVECRKRVRTSDVTWVEQLATKRIKVGASKTIAVSASRFSQSAIACAQRYGIELRVLGEITDEQIDDWILWQPSVHIYKSAPELKCTVHLVTGEIETLEGVEARFMHPLVHEVFPAAAFLAFLEMKDPSFFSAGGTFKIELDGQNLDVVPVPFGESRKPGGLSLRTDYGEISVERLVLEGFIDYHIDFINTAKGNHYSYDAPNGNISQVSHYDGAMFGIPVSIETFAKRGEHPSTMISWPGGPTTPSGMINPKITCMELVDVRTMDKYPIVLKIFGGKPTKGVLFDLPEEFFSSGEHKEAFDKDLLAFATESVFRKLQSGGLIGEKMSDYIYEIPKIGVEYIDITPTLKGLQKLTNERRSKLGWEKKRANLVRSGAGFSSPDRKAD